MSREPLNIEKQIDKAHQDSRRKYAFDCMLPDTNKPLECILLLGRLNETINLLLALQDNYYTDYIWNASSIQAEQLRAAGLEPNFFSDTEDKLRTLRSILVGDNLNFEELYRQLYDDALGHETYWHEFFEKRTRELERKIDRIEREQNP